MVEDPTLPKRPWQGYQGTREIVIDKSGIARGVYKNPHAEAEDHQRYERKKTFEDQNKPENKNKSDLTKGISGSAAVQGSSGAAPPTEQPATVLQGDWLQGLVAAYAASPPMTLSLDKNAPVVTPEMLVASDEELARMPPDTREGLGRVFLAIASKIYGDTTLKKTFLNGTMIKGYVPSEIVAYFRHLTGRV